jgi:hypothetical protein
VPTQVPTDADVIAAFVRVGCARIHTLIPAIVVAYDPTLQKCDVQPVIRPRVDDPLLGTERPAFEPLLPIPNLPVVWPSGQGASTFGLLPGMPVVVVVAERSTDEWRTIGAIDNIPLDARRFDLSDGYVWPGGHSFNPAAGLLAPLTVGVEIDAAGAHVVSSSIPAAGVKLGSAAAVNSVILGEILTTFLTTFTTTLAGSTDPAVVSAASALAISLGGGTHLSLKVKVDI